MTSAGMKQKGKKKKGNVYGKENSRGYSTIHYSQAKKKTH